ncbi:MAG: DedA family protein [Thermoplasmata archaeon]|nr:DedA family protein [Thermoplasmata archaeon]
MNPVSWLLEFILHLDSNLTYMIDQYGPWIYVILFAVVFCETGLVAFPFLPGDSLIFAAGALTIAYGSFNFWLLFIVFISAAILGDTVNYWIGHYLGPKVFRQENSKLFKKKYLDQAHEFYDRHGAKTIFLARFIPIIRTFAPFVAGVGRMEYRKFILYNIVGAFVWVSLFLGLGYVFGDLPAVKENITFLFIAIILVSFIPLVLMWLWEKKRKQSACAEHGKA